MGGQDDLNSSLKAIMAARREGLGEPPTPDELLAYRDGLLAPEELQRIAAQIACHPDAARTLADLLAFPEVEAAPGTPQLSEEEIDARWQDFRQRLPEQPVTFPAPAVRQGRRWGAAPRLVAAALLGLGVGWAADYAARAGRDHPGPAAPGMPATPAITEIAELAPVEEGLRSAPSPVELPESAEALVLVLGGRARAERELPSYEVEVVDRHGRRVAARHGLHPTALGTFPLSFRRADLPPGRYRIDLFGVERGSRVRLATYELRLAERGEAR